MGVILTGHSILGSAQFSRLPAIGESILDVYALAELQQTRTSRGRNGFTILNCDSNHFSLGLGTVASMGGLFQAARGSILMGT